MLDRELCENRGFRYQRYKAYDSYGQGRFTDLGYGFKLDDHFNHSMQEEGKDTFFQGLQV